MKKKIVSLVLVFALALALGIGGTVAWLTAQTESVVNTFTVGDINIDLFEHEYDPTTEQLKTTTTKENKNYKYVPGDTLPKDPYVVVKAGSEACYLFVKVTDSNNSITDANNNNKIVNWTIDSSWTAVADHPGYWYKEVAAITSDTTYPVLSNSVKVSEKVTKDMVPTLIGETTKPTITVVAAAVQKDNIDTFADVWAALPTTFTTP